jgi:hypothetical protein
LNYAACHYSEPQGRLAGQFLTLLVDVVTSLNCVLRPRRRRFWQVALPREIMAGWN